MARKKRGRQPLSSKSPSREVAVRLPGHLVKRVDERAAEVGMNRSAWLRAVILAVLQHAKGFGDWLPESIPEKDSPGTPVT